MSSIAVRFSCWNWIVKTPEECLENICKFWKNICQIFEVCHNFHLLAGKFAIEPQTILIQSWARLYLNWPKTFQCFTHLKRRKSKNRSSNTLWFSPVESAPIFHRIEPPKCLFLSRIDVRVLAVYVLVLVGNSLRCVCCEGLFDCGYKLIVVINWLWL